MKRLFDACLALVLLIALFPLLVAAAVLVRLKIGSPILFRQERPGWQGRIFVILKFRTMTDARGPDGNLLDDSKRLTRFGRFLRSTSLDELPELWNILRGDMSFVGPRPLLIQYLKRYTPEQARRHEVRPGLTGWAQIKGRNAQGWPERFAYDVWYVDNRNFWLDLKIMVITAWTVISRHGISEAGNATKMDFRDFLDKKTSDETWVPSEDR